MQIDGTKLIFIMNISVLDFFKFASRMPQIAQILVSTFKIFRGSMPLDPHRNFLFFSMSNSRLWFLVSRDDPVRTNRSTFCLIVILFQVYLILF